MDPLGFLRDKLVVSFLKFIFLVLFLCMRINHVIILLLRDDGLLQIVLVEVSLGYLEK